MTPAPATGEISGLHYATQQPIFLRWKDGIITEIALVGQASRLPSGHPARGATNAGETRDPAGGTPAPLPDLWLAPPLFDLQINGYGGVDFQQDNLSLEDLLSAVRRLRAAGCA